MMQRTGTLARGRDEKMKGSKVWRRKGERREGKEEEVKSAPVFLVSSHLSPALVN